MANLRTGILVVTHNSSAHIEACLDAIEAWRGENDRVLVIDNRSSDDTVAVIRGCQPVDLIVNQTNLGFAAAVNQGFRFFATSVSRVLILNPDVILTSPWTALEEACDRCGLATGRLTSNEGRTTQTGFSIRRFPTAWALTFETLGLNRIFPANPVNRHYRCLDFDYSKPAQVEQPAGALLMIRTDLWSLLGGFDESFFPVWFEDVDFSLRAAQAGYLSYYVPSVEGIHAGGHSVNLVPPLQRRLYWYASLLRYSRKHFRGSERQLIGGGVVLVGFARSLAAMVKPGAVAASKNETRRNWMKVARMGFDSCRSNNPEFPLPAAAPGRPLGNDPVPTLVPTEVQRLTADAAYGRGDGGVVDSSEIKNTERSLKRLHAR